jgi:hypothetical protein
VSIQLASMYEAGFAVLSSTHVRTIVVVKHRVVLQVRLLRESFTTARDLAAEWPLAGVCPLVGRTVVR